MDRLKCGCGRGGDNHFIGDPKCYRTECSPLEEPIKLPEFFMGKPMYLVESNIITECTLKEQRMYSQHEDGRWSMLKIPDSTNSLDA
jgi:hypothetical protein